ncbi:hypothetical protein E2562_039532 [Oryza meyeriana var. granulata]|uniref:Uncharacterized protein n=1 Tax=Oryza meyeriana var. granulata TaxID=110450 RepID=A0A6G1C327_9ORYZ|nr:hypothetical protein E2562_039532 [Oryza meyeriana var. granulata]
MDSEEGRSGGSCGDSEDFVNLLSPTILHQVARQHHTVQGFHFIRPGQAPLSPYSPLAVDPMAVRSWMSDLQATITMATAVKS